MSCLLTIDLCSRFLGEDGLHIELMQTHCNITLVITKQYISLGDLLLSTHCPFKSDIFSMAYVVYILSIFKHDAFLEHNILYSSTCSRSFTLPHDTPLTCWKQASQHF